MPSADAADLADARGAPAASVNLLERVTRTQALGRRLPRLFRTTPFRLTVMFLALFASASLALFAYIYVATAGEATRRTDQEITLQPREFRLLEYLMRHAGQVVTRTMLLENVWDYHFDPQTNVIDVHISRLRSKVDKGFSQPLLHTIRGAGYMIRDGAR